MLHLLPQLDLGAHLRSKISLVHLAGSQPPKFLFLSLQAFLWPAALAFFRIVGPTALALLLCNMDRICMSVAILPMAKEFGWPAGVQVRH